MTLTKQQISEGDEVIIRFLGYEYMKRPIGKGGYWVHPNIESHIEENKLSFHIKFDSLIPVCKKCKAIVDINSGEKQPELVEKWNDIYLTLGSMEIELIFSKVVDFIKIYKRITDHGN